MTYIILLLICVSLAFIVDRLKTDKKNLQYGIIVFFIIAFALSLISAIRYNVGTDYSFTYVPTFNYIAQGAAQIRIDIGFYLLNQIIIWLTLNVQWVFIVTSFIINFLICASIYKQISYKALGIFIYICGTLYFFSMNGVRQTITMSIFYYSLTYVYQKRSKVKYFLLNLFGVTMHLAAVMFLPLYFFIHKRLRRRTYLLIILLLVILITPITNLVGNYLLSTKYSMYLTNGAYSSLTSFNLSSILNLLCFLGYLFYSKKNSKNNVYLNIHFIGLVISLFLLRIPLVLRLFMSFRYIEFLSVPNLIADLNVTKRKRIIIITAVIIFYVIYLINGVYINNGNDVLPYRTIFGEES